MTIVKEILQQMPAVGKPQAKFLETLFATILALRGRVNFRNRRCRKGVDLMLDCDPKLGAIDEETNDQIVHRRRFGKANVRRTRRLIRVRNLMCLLLIFCVCSLPT